MADHLSIRVWPSDSTTTVFNRGPTGPLRVGSGCPVVKIRSIARTAFVAYTTDTISRSTASVPRTICNGPMSSLSYGGRPRPPGTDDNRAARCYSSVTAVLVAAGAAPPAGIRSPGHGGTYPTAGNGVGPIAAR